jgi:hypothetical protein
MDPFCPLSRARAAARRHRNCRMDLAKRPESSRESSINGTRSVQLERQSWKARRATVRARRRLAWHALARPRASEGAGRRSGAIEDHDLPSTDPDQPDAPEPVYITEIGDADRVVPPYEGRTGQSDAGGSQRHSTDPTGSSATPRSSGATPEAEERQHPDSTDDTERSVGPGHQSGVSRVGDQS